MADKTPSPTEKSAPQFSTRELELLGFAMQSLKSGPPEVDYQKFAGLAGMTNPKSASNAWAKIKVKLMAGPDGVAPTPKKAAAKKQDGDAATPKTPASRKRAPKKQDVDGEESPTKKPRAKKSAAIVKEEDAEEDSETKASGEDNAQETEV